jgi:hypothetical protein
MVYVFGEEKIRKSREAGKSGRRKQGRGKKNPPGGGFYD